MGYNRQEAKWLARDAMRGARPNPMLVTLVYLLLTGVLGSIVLSYVAAPFEAAYFYLTETTYSVEEIMTSIFTFSRLGLIFLMQFLLSLYNWVMGYGYTSYCLRMARREGPSYRNLLDGFYHIGRSLGVGFLTSLFTFLWGLIGVAFYMVMVMLSVVSGLMFPAMIGVVGMALWTVIVNCRYRLAPYFLLDNPEMGALEAIRHSKSAMRGHIVDLFVQDLSFLGWTLLVPFTLGILSFWLDPYMGAAQANFYNWVVYGSFPGQPQSNSWQGPYGNL